MLKSPEFISVTIRQLLSHCQEDNALLAKKPKHVCRLWHSNRIGGRMEDAQLRSRRRFLAQLGASAAAIAVARLFEPGVFAEELEKRLRTPEMTEGPFYPDHLPLDTDNDLLIVNDSITPAVGEVTHLSGKILDAKGDPIRNALVEIWQVDNHGVYLHSRDTHAERDKNSRA